MGKVWAELALLLPSPYLINKSLLDCPSPRKEPQIQKQQAHGFQVNALVEGLRG